MNRRNERHNNARDYCRGKVKSEAEIAVLSERFVFLGLFVVVVFCARANKPGAISVWEHPAPI